MVYSKHLRHWCERDLKFQLIHGVTKYTRAGNTPILTYIDVSRYCSFSERRLLIYI